MKTKWILLAGMVLIALIGGPMISAGAWFGSSNSPEIKKSQTPTEILAAKKAAQQPSFLSKIGTGTKRFVSAIGNTLTPKTSAAKTPPASQFGLGTHPVTPSPAAVQSLGSNTPSSATGTTIRSQAPSKEVRSSADFMALKRVDP